MKIYQIAFLVALALWIGAGCGTSSGPQLYTVTGHITADEKPLAEGEIVLEAMDGRGASYSGPIVDGKYSFRSTAGLKRVLISALQRVEDSAMEPATPGNPVGPDNPAFRMIETIPAHYNLRSRLRVEVTSTGPNEFPFQLTTRP